MRMHAGGGGGAMRPAELGMAVLMAGLGFAGADMLDRFIATYNPAGTTAPSADKFTSTGAGTLANTFNVASRPSLMRLGAGAGAVALPAVVAMTLAKRSPMARASLEGMAVGAGVNFFKVIWSNVLIPLLTPKDTSVPSLQKSLFVRLYPTEITAHLNLAAHQMAVAPGALSGAPAPQLGVGAPDVGPFALAGDSSYPDAAQALRRAAGVQDQPYPSLQNTWGTGGPGSDYPTAAQAMRGGVGDTPWQPGPPSDIGPGPQAKPNADCGCVGDPLIGSSMFLGEPPAEDVS